MAEPDTDDSNLVAYNFKGNIFELWASSFLLAIVLQKQLTQFKTTTARDIEINLLVDNVVTGCDTETEANRYFTEARQILCKAKMNLRKWNSKSTSIRQMVKNKGEEGAEDA